jgi:hypothetical protein
VADRRESNGAGSGKSLVLRCAWCGRIEVDGTWLAGAEEQAPEIIEGRSHGICPDCNAKLTPRAPL